MGKRNLLLASSIVTAILAVLIGSSFTTAATTGGGGPLPEGCKKSYCADTVLDTDLGEECVPGTPTHDLDICSDGIVNDPDKCEAGYEA